MAEELEVFDNFIIFQFIERVSNGMIDSKISSILVSAAPSANTQSKARWGRVVKKGPKVTDIEIGDCILIEPLQWSTGENIKLNGVEQQYWRTDITKILAVADEADVELY
jgi:hypothetical protein